MIFSERYGYKSTSKIIQKDSINDSLKNRLWSVFYEQLFSKIDHGTDFPYTINSNINQLVKSCWLTVLQKPIDTIPQKTSETIAEIRNYFFSCEWHQIYSIIEETLSNFPYHQKLFKQKFESSINDALELESSAYRVIKNRITAITSEQEIQCLEEALVNTNQFSGVQQHLNQAVKLMSDRQNPDYRNSIKESISAIEALGMLLLDNNKITLGKAIPILKTKYDLHPTLMEGLNKLYGYASDENGVRHGSPNQSSVTYIDAKFMLVACTNFTNYLIEKTK